MLLRVVRHQEHGDLKPGAPSDIRRVRPAKRVGVQVCEHMPLMAKMMDKFAIIRSMADSQGVMGCTNASRVCPATPEAADSIASMGLGSRLWDWSRGHARSPHPHASHRAQAMGRPWRGGFLGRQHGPFRLGRGKDDNAGLDTVENMTLRTPSSVYRTRACVALRWFSA